MTSGHDRRTIRKRGRQATGRYATRCRGGFDVLTVFGLLGLAFLIGAAWTGKQQYNVITAWPTVSAKVTRSRVTAPKPSSYSAEIQFQYVVNGKPYTTTVNPGYETSTLAIMKSLVDSYAPGSQHTIHYNPTNPNDIHYDAGFSLNFFMLSLILGFMGVVFGGIGIGPWLWDITDGRRRRFRIPMAKKLSAGPDRFPIIIGGIFAVIGVLLLAITGWLGYEQYKVNNWPTVSAQVNSSRVVRYSTKSSNNRSSTTYYAAEVEFRYIVNDKAYTTPTTAEEGTASREQVQSKLDTLYAPGTTHTIRYNPTDPDYIQFQSSFSFWIWVLGALGIGFLAMGILAMVVFRPIQPIQNV